MTPAPKPEAATPSQICFCCQQRTMDFNRFRIVDGPLKDRLSQELVLCAACHDCLGSGFGAAARYCMECQKFIPGWRNVLKPAAGRPRDRANGTIILCQSCGVAWELAYLECASSVQAQRQSTTGGKPAGQRRARGGGQ